MSKTDKMIEQPGASPRCAAATGSEVKKQHFEHDRYFDGEWVRSSITDSNLEEAKSAQADYHSRGVTSRIIVVTTTIKEEILPNTKAR